MKATTVNQSLYLRDKGIYPKTADCKWVERENAYQKWFSLDIGRPVTAYEVKHCPPAWTLDALLKLMPKVIVVEEVTYVLTIEYTGEYNRPKISYMSDNFEYCHSISAKTTFVAAYRMVCWLLKNGFIKKRVQRRK